MGATEALRVLMVSNAVSRDPRSLYTLELARGLMARGHTVLILTPRQPPPVARRHAEVPLRVEPALERPLLKSLSLGLLFRELQSWEPDILHVQSVRALPQGHLLSSHLGLPTVISAHASGERLRGLRSLVRHGAGIIASTESIREDLVNRGRVAKTNIRVIPIGAPERTVQEPVSWTDRGPRRIPVVATIGELEPRSGLRFFLEAARDVLDSGTQAEFLVVGTGSEKRALRALAERLGVKLRVSFCDPSPDLMQQLSAVDILVVTSLDEAHRPVTLEAMIQAKPVVAFGVGAIFEAIEEEEAGLLVEKGDSRKLAQAIRRLIIKPDFAMRLARRAQEVVGTRFSLARTLDETVDYYRCLIPATTVSSTQEST